MDFSLTKEQIEWKESVKEFARREIAPSNIEVDQKAEVSWENWKKMADFGLLGMAFPKKYGGKGASPLETVQAFEGFAAGGGGFGTAAHWHCHMDDCGMSIVEHGKEVIKNKYLPKMARGELVGAFGLTEAGAGSDVSRLTTTAIRQGGDYLLNGMKTFITNAPVCNLATVIAYTDKPKGHREGMSAFIVEEGFPGFSKGPGFQGDKLGEHAVTTGELRFSNCRVPVENMLGNEGQGWQIMRDVLFWERYGPLGLTIGHMEEMLEKCIKYSKKRVTFGKPIAQHQVIRHKLADMKVRLEASRFLVYKIAWEKEREINDMMNVSIAKLFCSESFLQNATEGIQVLGGRGYMREYEIERNFRDARLLTIAAGTSEIQREIIGNRLIRLPLPDDLEIMRPGILRSEV